MPSFSVSHPKMPMTVSPDTESSAPVGSSASRMRGRPAMARAMATRCC
jgi:hypothetical protein